jgi:hypothetical protein
MEGMNPMLRALLLAGLSVLAGSLAYPCTCVEAKNSNPYSVAEASAETAFWGTVTKREILPRRPEMRGRDRFAVTFRVAEYWKGKLARIVVVYDLAPSADCQGRDYEEGGEYLVYASFGPSRDVKLDDHFWYGWTDVVTAGTAMLQPIMGCIPGNPANRTAARRIFGKGRRPSSE